MRIPFRPQLRAVKRAVYALVGQDLYVRPEVSLPVAELGSEYGSFGVWTEPLHPESVVYSVGVGEDVSFDLALMETCGVRVYAFDPTPHSVAWLETQSLPAAFCFEAVGLAAHDGTADFHLPADPRSDVSAAMDRHQTTRAETVTLPVRRLATLMATRGHHRIDCLKMDVEGAEYAILDDVLDSDIEVDQLLVEVHHFLGTAAERRAGVARTRRLLRRMRAAGFRVFAISELGHDYSFVRLAADGRPAVGPGHQASAGER